MCEGKCEAKLLKDLSKTQGQVNVSFKGLTQTRQEKFQTVAFIVNRPFGLIEHQGRSAVEKKALKDIVNRMATLDNSCGVLSSFFGANVDDLSKNHYFKASSSKMEDMVKEEVAAGIIARIISQKHRPVLEKELTEKQWYTAFMDGLVHDAREYPFAFARRKILIHLRSFYNY